MAIERKLKIMVGKDRTLLLRAALDLEEIDPDHMPTGFIGRILDPELFDEFALHSTEKKELFIVGGEMTRYSVIFHQVSLEFTATLR
jgi:hypothetical protein